MICGKRISSVSCDKLHPFANRYIFFFRAKTAVYPDILRDGKPIVANPQTFCKDMGLGVMINLNVLIRKPAAESDDEMSASCRIFLQGEESCLIRRVQAGNKYHAVFLKVHILWMYDVVLDVVPIQGIGNPAEDCIVTLRFQISRGELRKAGERFVVYKDCGMIFFSEIFNLAFDFFKLCAKLSSLTVGFICGKIVGEHTLPVAFEGVVYGMPMPVHHAVRAVCKMAVSAEPQLPRERQPLRISLCLSLQYQVVSPL